MPDGGGMTVQVEVPTGSHTLKLLITLTNGGTTTFKVLGGFRVAYEITYTFPLRVHFWVRELHAYLTGPVAGQGLLTQP